MTGIDLDTGLKGLSLALSVVAIVWTWVATRRANVDDRFEAGSKRMDHHDLRLQALEQTVAEMPGKDAVHHLELAMAEIRGDLKGISATMTGMAESMGRTEQILTRHEDYLREEKP